MSLSRAEKVAAIRAARRAHPGWTNQQVAHSLGMTGSAFRNLLNDPDGSKQRARRETYVGVCEDCGGQTRSDGTSHPSPVCRECARLRAIASRVWTREAIIEAIRRWAAEHGRPPTATDWQHAAPGGSHPAAATVYRQVSQPNAPFALWADAIEAAGFPRPGVGKYERTPETLARLSAALTIWDREAILAAITAWATEHGVAPAGADLPSCRSAANARGWSWPALVREAGFAPRIRINAVRWTPERITEAICDWTASYGNPPKTTQWMDSKRDRRYPCTATVLRVYRHWATALEAAGISRTAEQVAA